MKCGEFKITFQRSKSRVKCIPEYTDGISRNIMDHISRMPISRLVL